MKDYKLSEIKNVCKNNPLCYTCPLDAYCEERTIPPIDWEFEIDKEETEE